MDRYIINGKYGDGAFGTVFQGVHRASGVRVAIKRMRRTFATWEECLGLREIEALRRVKHPSIVRLFEVVREKERLYLVFEFVVRRGLASPSHGASGHFFFRLW